MLEKDQFKCVICGEIHYVEGSDAPEARDDYDTCYDVYTAGDKQVFVGTACQKCFDEHSSAWTHKKYGVIFGDDIERWLNNEIPHTLSSDEEKEEDEILKRHIEAHKKEPQGVRLTKDLKAMFPDWAILKPGQSSIINKKICYSRYKDNERLIEISLEISLKRDSDGLNYLFQIHDDGELMFSEKVKDVD